MQGNPLSAFSVYPAEEIVPARESFVKMLKLSKFSHISGLQSSAGLVNPGTVTESIATCGF